MCCATRRLRQIATSYQFYPQKKGPVGPPGDQDTLQGSSHQICVTALLLAACEVRQGSKILAYCLKKFGTKNAIENL